ncbi:BURP domain protein USPL1 [Capsicum galapagoense]
MDLKLDFCVLSLILLVAYGTEARKNAQGNFKSSFISQDNHQQALKMIYGSEYPFHYYKYKQEAEDKHQFSSSRNFLFYSHKKQEISSSKNFLFYLYKKQEVSGSKNFLFYLPKEQGNDEQEETLNEYIHLSSHIDPSLASLYFLIDDLKIGKTIKDFSFPSRSSLPFFPKAAADSIPFSLKELPNLLQRFSLSKDSPQAKAMEDALRVCEFNSSIKGERKYCATSAEAMLNFVQEILGERTQIKAMSTTTHSPKDSNSALQNYTILDSPKEVVVPKMVACHIMSCAYTVFYCHPSVSTERKMFKVPLGNEENGDRVEAIVVCHLNTSDWSPSHFSFQVLGILPGASPVCHFLPSSNDLVWVPKTIVT